MPTLELSFGGIVEPGSYEPGFGVWGALKLNGVLGGQASITLQKLGEYGFEPVTDFGTLNYTPGDEDEHGVLNFGYVDQDLENLWGVDDTGIRYKAKFVIEYTFPDGTTGVLESPVFEQYGGGFAHYANSSELWYDAENQQVVAEVALDLSLVEPENVSIKTTSANFDCWTSLPAPSLSSSYYAGDGTYRMVFVIPLETLTPGEYWCDIGLRYSNGTGPLWEQELFIICNLD